ncbi:MAG: hypothetical protein ACRDQD_00630 [Nocardioidaceae bacterium]
MKDQLVIIDPHGTELDRLGPANEEQRADVKATRRTQQRKVLRDWATVWGTVLIGGALISIGTVLGNSLDADVTDIREPLTVLVRGVR